MHPVLIGVIAGTAGNRPVPDHDLLCMVKAHIPIVINRQRCCADYASSFFHYVTVSFPSLKIPCGSTTIHSHPMATTVYKAWFSAFTNCSSSHFSLPQYIDFLISSSYSNIIHKNGFVKGSGEYYLKMLDKYM